MGVGGRIGSCARRGRQRGRDGDADGGTVVAIAAEQDNENENENQNGAHGRHPLGCCAKRLAPLLYLHHFAGFRSLFLFPLRCCRGLRWSLWRCEPRRDVPVVGDIYATMAGRGRGGLAECLAVDLSWMFFSAARCTASARRDAEGGLIRCRI